MGFNGFWLWALLVNWGLGGELFSDALCYNAKERLPSII